jgi:putative ABC transport system permease protein
MSDLKYALRQLARYPAFALVVVVTLALGIGANTSIFSVVYGVLIRPLPYPEPEQIVAVWESNPAPGWSERNLVTTATYVDWRERNTVFADLAAYSYNFGLAAVGDEAPVEITSVRVTPNLFDVLGATAAHGRVFVPEDGVPGAEPVVLLSQGVWRDRFGADPAVVGRTIQLEEQPVTVVGVMPAAFDFPNPTTDAWLPMRWDQADRQNRRSHSWLVIGRLRDGRTIQQAQAEMDAITMQLREEHPLFMEGFSVKVVPFRADLVRATQPLLLLLLGVVGTLLLIACANVANLFLARAIRREREFAVRGALGGTRRRLIRQLLVEAGALGALGVVGGVALGAWGVEVLVAMAPGDVPLLDDVRLDGGVLAYTAAAGVLSTLLFGVVPAWRASRTDLETALKAGRGAGSMRHGRLRTALLVGELALSLVLLVGAGLLVRSFLALQAVDHGFRPERLLVVGLNLPYSRYDGTPDHDAFYGRLIERLAAQPGIESVAGTAEPPLIGFNNGFSFVIEGRPSAEPDGEYGPVPVRAVTVEYFQTMGIPVLDGRAFNRFDRLDQPRVLVVNETLARRYWPGESAVGKRVGFDDQGGPWLEIVGVVGDTRHFGLDQPIEPAIYMPYAQKRWGWMSWLTLMIRTRGEPMDVVPAVQQTIWALDDRLPIRELATVTDLYAESNARRRFAATLVVGFAGLAVFLGLFGVYGVVSYSVAQRKREFGVRVALGAEGRRIELGVLREALVIAGIGVVIGLAGALLLTNLMKSLLFGVAASDPLTYVTTALLLTGVALLACWIPARRAARTDPMEALRYE